MNLNESIIEDAALDWFGELDYTIGHGSQHPHTLPSMRDRLPPKILSGETTVN